MPQIQLPSGKSIWAEKHPRPVGSVSPDIPILFIHGMNNSSKTWEPILPAFMAYTRIVYDVEPFGESRPTGGPLDIPSQARDTRDVLAHYGYAAAYVVAHSGGSSIARQFAHDNPHMVRKLVLLSPVVLGSSSGWPLDRIIVPTETSVLQWQANAGTRGRSDPAVMNFIRSETERHAGREEDAYRYFVALTKCDVPDAGGVEAWVLKGEEEKTPKVDCEGTAEKLNARLLEVKDAGHYLTIENTEGTVEALKTALQT